MADYTNSRTPLGDVYPENALESVWERLGALLTPEELVARFLFGIPLVSNMKDPVTGKTAVMTPDLLKVYIEDAVAIAETESGLDIFPVRRKERHAFDRHEFHSFGYFKLKHRPVSSTDSLEIKSADDLNIFTIPPQWIEPGHMIQGQINILPLSPANASFSYAALGQGGPAGFSFMSTLARLGWIPAYWTIEYTSGFPDGKIPRIVNELIGCCAALKVLSMLAATYAKSSSHSLGIDGMSQSISTPGPQLFATRIQELEEQKKRIIGKLKAMMGLKLFSGNV